MLDHEGTPSNDDDDYNNDDDDDNYNDDDDVSDLVNIFKKIATKGTTDIIKHFYLKLEAFNLVISISHPSPWWYHHQNPLKIKTNVNLYIWTYCHCEAETCFDWIYPVQLDIHHIRNSYIKVHSFF